MVINADLYVDSDETLAELMSGLAEQPLIALDTEFVRESTYYPKLCLVQIATDKVIACVDCLATIDLERLFATLLEKRRTWILHSARQDLEVLWLKTRARAPRLIDTQLAAALCGFTPQIGLQDLLLETLGVELSKGYARTDWTRRPLPEAALRYAFDDVRFLLALWRELEQRLTSLDRLEWLVEDCEAALEEPLTPDPLVLWGRLGGVHGLSRNQQCAALALVRWREQTAQRLDRPRRWIMQDAALLNAAKADPQDLDALSAVRDVPPRLVERRGSAVLEALRQGRDPGLRALVDAWPTPEVPDKALTSRLQERVRARATELGIASEVLATRRDIVELANQGSAGRTAWRAGELAALLG
jgi:ribonuclease D